MLTYDQINYDDVTPMMQQYLKAKRQHPDSLLFFRLGDFFELFFDDAITASKELELTLTQRDCGLDEKAPMCGVPHHAANSYINQLVQKGYRVAICEQMEDPAVAKGIVKRSVIKVVTPGTIMDDKQDTSKYSYLVSVYQVGSQYGLAACDLATGKFETCEIFYGATEAKVLDQLACWQPTELLCNDVFSRSEACNNYLRQYQCLLTLQPDNAFSDAVVEGYTELLSSEPVGYWQQASACLLRYLEDTQFVLPEHIKSIKPFEYADFMALDIQARRNLELSETIRDRKKRGSLIWAIDRCKTSMGSRLLRTWMERPLMNIHDIHRRQDAVGQLIDAFIERQSLLEQLTGLYDLERLAGRIALNTATPRDLRSLCLLLQKIPALREAIENIQDPYIHQIYSELNPLNDLTDLLDRALVDEPPITITEGHLIKEGFNESVDHYRDATIRGKDWIVALEQREREATGIKSLKVRYNRVFGYYIEVTKSNLDLVPEHYVRKQTLANSERYHTDELKSMEDTILGAEQKLQQLEYDLFISLRERVAEDLSALQHNASLLAQIDVLAGLAELAERENYCKPHVVVDSILDIEGGRHPVVERMIEQSAFVPNDVKLDEKERRLMILTGPNMSGKSTYMRQTALIVLMAQMGSFVPADNATIGITDQIFTRVGAADDVGGGQSTFMVEMNEVAYIMRQATDRSLLILDEIGRGTSTFDGLSIAWSVVEHIADPTYLGARTLFATHYHELTELANHIDGVFNAHIEVSEQGDDIVFLHQIKDGGTDDSYGIDVAKLAGVPERVVYRARDVLHLLEKNNQGRRLNVTQAAQPMEGQIDLFSAEQELNQSRRVMDKIIALDLNDLSPREAWSYLYDLQKEAAGKGK